jgi:phage host-nuclease inhibitor protein Gam
MAKKTEEKTTIDLNLIDKEELLALFNTITDNLIEIDSFREVNNDTVKEIKDKYGFKPALVRAAANAMYKRKKEELQEKYDELTTIIDLVESAKRNSSKDL